MADICVVCKTNNAWRIKLREAEVADEEESQAVCEHVVCIYCVILHLEVLSKVNLEIILLFPTELDRTEQTAHKMSRPAVPKAHSRERHSSPAGPGVQRFGCVHGCRQTATTPAHARLRRDQACPWGGEHAGMSTMRGFFNL